MLIRLNQNVPWKGFGSVEAFSGKEGSLARPLVLDLLALWLHGFLADQLVEAETPVRSQFLQIPACAGAALCPQHSESSFNSFIMIFHIIEIVHVLFCHSVGWINSSES